MRALTQTEADVRVLGEKLAASETFGFDTETSSDNPMQDAQLHWDKLFMVGCSFGFQDGSSTYVPVRNSEGNAPEQPVRDLLQRVFADKTKRVWAHNWKFDLSVLDSLDIDPVVEIRDTMIVAWLLQYGLGGDQGHKLKPLAKHYLGETMQEWEDMAKGRRGHQVPAREMGPYAGGDALQCLRLAEKFWPDMDQLGLLEVFTKLEMPFVRVLRHMEDVGFKIDQQYLINLDAEYKAESEPARIEFEKLVGAGIKSPLAADRLYDQLKWWDPEGFARGKPRSKVPGTLGSYPFDKGAYETALQRCKPGTQGHKAATLKAQHAQYATLIATYTLKMNERANRFSDGRLRSSLKQHGTATGRLSSSDPNLQNIPIRTAEGARLRDAFVAEEGWRLAGADYSQADLRMMAHLSQDPMLMKAYTDDVDVHQQTADNAGCDRGTGKTLNLGLIYEMSPGTLAANLGCSEARALKLWQAWHNTYKRVRPYHERMHAYARKHGLVRTITGRIRRIPEIDSEIRGVRRYAERTASNTPDQGSVADVIKIAMRDTYEDWKKRGVLYDARRKTGDAKLCMQIHDELIAEVREGREDLGHEMEKHMENAVQLRVPMKASVKFGKSWGSCH